MCFLLFDYLAGRKVCSADLPQNVPRDVKARGVYRKYSDREVSEGAKDRPSAFRHNGGNQKEKTVQNFFLSFLNPDDAVKEKRVINTPN